MFLRKFSKLFRQFFNLHRSHLIYEILCADSEGVYVEQTSQFLKNRLQGHKSNINHTELTERKDFDLRTIQESKRVSRNYKNC